MTRAQYGRSPRRRFIASQIVLVVLALGAVPPAVQAATPARLAPQLLSGVPGTSDVYVVSVRSTFESNNPGENFGEAARLLSKHQIPGNFAAI